MQKEMTSAEVRVEDEIRQRCAAMDTPVQFVHGKTLLHPADLPFEISETPDVFTPFRKRVEVLGPSMVRPIYRAPDTFKPYPADVPDASNYKLDVTYEVDVDGLLKEAPETSPKRNDQISFYDILRYLLLPLNDSNFPPPLETSALLQQRHHASAFPLRGGESSALDRLEWYFLYGKSPDTANLSRAHPPVTRYKQTRNNLLGHGYSTKMSPFLAYGSISPRQIWAALVDHERVHGEDQNTYWVKFELLWRDYFFFVAEKFGDLLFHIGGFELATDPAQAQKKLQGYWKDWDPDTSSSEHEVTRMLEGRTGIPFIDANMCELRESGFLSNRGRQNVASYLAHDLVYDWRIGAEFFQSCLIDYDPTSNYGNWAYVAGVGNDPRASRRFNIIKQAKDYDSHGEYVKTWLPVLRGLPADFVHTPWLLDPEERKRYGVKGSEQHISMVAYPEKPMTEDEGWKKHYHRKEGMGSRMFGNPHEKVKDSKLKKTRRPGGASELEYSSDPGGPRRGSGSDPSVPRSAATFRTGPPLRSALPLKNIIMSTAGSMRSNSPFSRANGGGALGGGNNYNGYRTGAASSAGNLSSPSGGYNAAPGLPALSPHRSSHESIPRSGTSNGQGQGSGPYGRDRTSPPGSTYNPNTRQQTGGSSTPQQHQQSHSATRSQQSASRSRAEEATSWRRG